MSLQKYNPKPPGLPGVPHSKQQGKEIALTDEMTYEHMGSYRLLNRCKDIIFSMSEKQLMATPMYTISCNVMCVERDNDDLYIPLELAIYSYSIENGEAKPLYLTFINPGPPPQGMMGEAKGHANDTKYKVPFEPCADFLEYARTDYREIYKEILEYVGEERIVLCQDDRYLQQIHGVLKWLAKKANDRPKRTVNGLFKARGEELPAADTWTVFDIKDYVYVAGKRLQSPLIADVYISMLLEDISHAYIADFNCAWHNEAENETIWCAKSCAKRMIANIAGLLEWFKTNYEEKTGQTNTLEVEGPNSSKSGPTPSTSSHGP